MTNRTTGPKAQCQGQGKAISSFSTSPSSLTATLKTSPTVPWPMAQPWGGDPDTYSDDESPEEPDGEDLDNIFHDGWDMDDGQDNAGEQLPGADSSFLARPRGGNG
eukprot:123945-Heterocapsa_arctica.AAC.1